MYLLNSNDCKKIVGGQSVSFGEAAGYTVGAIIASPLLAISAVSCIRGSEGLSDATVMFETAITIVQTGKEIGHKIETMIWQ